MAGILALPTLLLLHKSLLAQSDSPPINPTPRPYLIYHRFVLYSTLGHVGCSNSCGGYILMGVTMTHAG